MADSENNIIKNNLAPPGRSKNVFMDALNFLFHHPPHKTYIRFKSLEDRLSFRHRILQRVGMDASNYSVLNVHKIGIDAPVQYVFEELMNWNGQSTCWPNHIAKVDRINDKIENIRILPFGWTKYLFGIKNGIFGFKYIPLFNLNAVRIQSVPGLNEADNARYMLYKSTGGYPIGFFTLYVRSSVDDQGETEQSQLFFGVGFDFFGRKNWANRNIVVRFWSLIHNRVTNNVMNRFKQLCEWRFEKIRNG